MHCGKLGLSSIYTDMRRGENIEIYSKCMMAKKKTRSFLCYIGVEIKWSGMKILPTFSLHILGKFAIHIQWYSNIYTNKNLI